jgi:hypothetical protein
VIALDPCGVPGFFSVLLLPPPHPTNDNHPAVSNITNDSNRIRWFQRRAFQGLTAIPRMPASAKVLAGIKGTRGLVDSGSNFAVAAVVVITNVLVADPLVGVTAAGEKAQVASLGRVPQENFMLPE